MLQDNNNPVCVNKHIASTWHNIGNVYSKEGWEGNNPKLALEAFQHAIRMYTTIYGSNHPVVAVSDYQLTNYIRHCCVNKYEYTTLHRTHI